MVLHIKKRPLRALPPPSKSAKPLITPLLSIVISLTNKARTELEYEDIEAEKHRKARRRRRNIRKAKALAARIKIRRYNKRKRKLIREAQRDDYVEGRKQRHYVLTRNRMTMEQMREERDARREELLAAGALTMHKGETLDECYWRWRAINKEFGVLWDRHSRGVIASEPRYVEGWPVRDLVSKPVIHWNWKYKNVKRSACLQCRAKNLACSLTKERFDPDRQEETPACARCVRHGQRHECMKRYGKRQEDGRVKWIYKARDVDPERYSDKVRKYEEPSEELNQEMEKIGKVLVDVRHGIVVDIMGGSMQEVAPRNFVLPKHKKQLKWRKAR